MSARCAISYNPALNLSGQTCSCIYSFSMQTRHIFWWDLQYQVYCSGTDWKLLNSQNTVEDIWWIKCEISFIYKSWFGPTQLQKHTWFLNIPYTSNRREKLKHCVEASWLSSHLLILAGPGCLVQNYCSEYRRSQQNCWDPYFQWKYRYLTNFCIFGNILFSIILHLNAVIISAHKAPTECSWLVT